MRDMLCSLKELTTGITQVEYSILRQLKVKRVFYTLQSTFQITLQSQQQNYNISGHIQNLVEKLETGLKSIIHDFMPQTISMKRHTVTGSFEEFHLVDGISFIWDVLVTRAFCSFHLVTVPVMLFI